jgi:hypothetical protein
MESADCGECRTWRVQDVESAGCGECRLWRVQVVESAVCGECRLWRVQVVESAGCGECRLWRVQVVESAVLITFIPLCCDTAADISMCTVVKHNKLLLNSSAKATCFGFYRPRTGDKVRKVKYKYVCIEIFRNLRYPTNFYKLFPN